LKRKNKEQHLKQQQLEMCGKAQRDSLILELLVPPGEYIGMIRPLPVSSGQKYMIPTPNFMDI